MTRAVFGKRLAELRKNRGMTQTDLAKHMDMSHSSVASWETGTRDPDSEMITKLAGFFKVTTDYLLGHSDFTEGSDNDRSKTKNPFPVSTEKEFVDSIDLADETILERFQLEYNGKALTKEQAKLAVALLRTILQQDKE